MCVLQLWRAKLDGEKMEVRMLVVAGVRPRGGVRYKCANGEDGCAVTVPICCCSGCCCRWSCTGGVAEARWSEKVGGGGCVKGGRRGEN
ncbi:hypothetical protein DEO72_LG6g1320 [Vigna unguiculata]|uniref:Uncharacterized protein n=1 Tax=Vigna unguiculata TaxID=3917 RepID=A0A4D6M721_VIGUN|nr:hypothetical protein DEO72_LG6g1320 [Vigna unguiculata]